MCSLPHEQFVDAYVMEESSDVISLGMRCEVRGHVFYWLPFSHRPIFTGAAKPGRKVEK